MYLNAMKAFLIDTLKKQLFDPNFEKFIKRRNYFENNKHIIPKHQDFEI